MNPVTTESTGARRAGRVEAIDAVRGFAIIAMCVSHVGEMMQDQLLVEGTAMRWIGLVATPTFLLLSGVSSGYVLRPEADLLRRVRFIDRAMFLFLIAHLIISVCHVYDQSVDWKQSFASIYITDVVAVALCVAVWLRRADSRILIWAGIFLCVLTWPMAWYWHPTTFAADVTDRILFYGGDASRLRFGYTVPVAAYLGLYLAGFGFSRMFRRQVAGEDALVTSRRVFCLAAAGIMVVVAAKIASHQARTHVDLETYTLLWRMSDPRLKFPPGPAYLLLFVSLAAMVYAAVLRLRILGRAAATVRFLSTLGQASLMTYLLQEVIIYLVPNLAGFARISSLTFWLAYLFATVATIWLAARWWVANDGNRWISVGLTALARRRTATATANF